MVDRARRPATPARPHAIWTATGACTSVGSRTRVSTWGVCALSTTRRPTDSSSCSATRGATRPPARTCGTRGARKPSRSGCPPRTSGSPTAAWWRYSASTTRTSSTMSRSSPSPPRYFGTAGCATPLRTDPCPTTGSRCTRTRRASEPNTPGRPTRRHTRPRPPGGGWPGRGGAPAGSMRRRRRPRAAPSCYASGTPPSARRAAGRGPCGGSGGRRRGCSRSTDPRPVRR